MMSTALTVTGCIERRLLVNLRVDPAAVAPYLPAPFRPLEVEGRAIAGLCLIRLTDLRPPGVPRAAALTTENAAHRIAVEWRAGGRRHTGVWIPWRHTASALTARLGGRAFPAVHERARFEVDDAGDRLRITVIGRDAPIATVTCGATTDLAPGSVFGSAAAAHDFFVRDGAVGVSPSRRAGRGDVVTLTTGPTTFTPLVVEQGELPRFTRWWPEATWDSAFVVRDLPCSWSGRTGGMALDFAEADRARVA
jgi:hypothetical protein